MNPLHRLATAGPVALILATLGVTCMLSSANAENFRIVFDQVGANVVATGSGSLTDLDGLTLQFSSNSSPLINPSPLGPNVRVGATASARFYLGDFVVTGSLGSINLTSNASSGAGPIFGYTGSFVALPFSYSLGTPLSSTATWTNTTIEALGMNPGATANISWNTGSRSMVVSVVPEPAIAIMALAGIACGGYSMWRRRRRAEVRAAASLASAIRHVTMDEITTTVPRVGTLLSTLHVGLVVFFGGFGLSNDVQADTVAFWSGNGNANDSVGGHNGTLVNGAGFAAGQFGQQAFSLNSSGSQYISVPDSPAWDFGSNPFSIAMLVNFTSISGGGLGSGANALMGHDEGGGATNKWFFSYMSDGTLGFHINSTGGSGVFLTSPSALPVATGTWNLFAITRSGSTYTFYENATSLGTVNYSTALPAIAAPLTIGQAGEGIGFVNGRLQNVQIFDTALSASEVAALVPEPSTYAMALAGIACGGYSLWQRRKRA